MRCGAGDLSIVHYLLRHGADITRRTDKGCTAFLLAAQHSHLLLCHYLLQHGSEVNATDDKGATALTWAAYENNANLVRYLLQCGFNVEHADKEGMRYVIAPAVRHAGCGRAASATDRGARSSLHWAACKGNTEAARVLLENGADVAARCAEGKTPFDYAIQKKHHELADLLRRHAIFASQNLLASSAGKASKATVRCGGLLERRAIMRLTRSQRYDMLRAMLIYWKRFVVWALAP